MRSSPLARATAKAAARIWLLPIHHLTPPSPLPRTQPHPSPWGSLWCRWCSTARKGRSRPMGAKQRAGHPPEHPAAPHSSAAGQAAGLLQLRRHVACAACGRHPHAKLCMNCHALETPRKGLSLPALSPRHTSVRACNLLCTTRRRWNRVVSRLVAVVRTAPYLSVMTTTPLTRGQSLRMRARMGSSVKSTNTSWSWPWLMMYVSSASGQTGQRRAAGKI